VETEAVVEITGDMLRETSDNFVVPLQRVREVEGSHNEHVFTRKPHAYKLSMKVSLISGIIYYCTLRNYKYSIH